MKKTKHEAPRTDKKRSQLLEVWGRLKKSKVAIAGLVILTLLILMAVFADVGVAVIAILNAMRAMNVKRYEKR